jgi:ubiquinol-cytochrome c reductase cytochrome c subunit
MGLRLLRKILVPFAALVLAACVGTLAMGRVHGTSDASASQSPEAMSLTALQSQTTKGQIAYGYQLFAEHCSFCHGTKADGSTGIAPNLRGLGPGTIELWLSTGWMPLKTPSAQPENKPPDFSASQIRDVAMWVASLHPGGTPFAPSLNLKTADDSNGFSLFTLNCAPCHTITGAGDALADGYHAPPLHGVTEAQIWEAVRSGPQNMPQFSDNNITPSQLDNIIKYVTGKIERPEDPGGLALGGVGPVAEGFVGLFAGVGACLLAAYWVGDRTERDEDEDEHETGSDAAPEGAHA